MLSNSIATRFQVLLKPKRKYQTKYITSSEIAANKHLVWILCTFYQLQTVFRNQKMNQCESGYNPMMTHTSFAPNIHLVRIASKQKTIHTHRKSWKSTGQFDKLVHRDGIPQSPHRISAGGRLLFMRCVPLTLTGLVSAWRRGEAPSAILAKPLSDCVTVSCLRQCKSRHLNVCEILKKYMLFSNKLNILQS